MACETAVVATATGGIVEVVVDEETGLLVPFETAGDGSTEPADATTFAADFAERVNTLLRDPALAERMGECGRRRAEQQFAWPAIAQQTVAVYRRLLGHLPQT
jgi:alpha-maltose-1-phosphate synthase